jgi:mannose-6-phosphate isomerase-like protein (cupin superfamily)
VKHRQLRFGRGFRIAIDGKRAQVAEMVIPPGGREGDPENRHRGADQWLFVVCGTGVAIVNGHRVKLKSGTMLMIEHQDRHEIRNTGATPLKTLNFYVPRAYTAQGNELPAAKRSAAFPQQRG